MIRNITFTNEYGASYTFSFDESIEQNGGILVSSIDGLGPVKARINMMNLAGEDGQLFNSAKLEGRNIVVMFELTDTGFVEDERQLLYRVFPIKEKVNIEIETDNRLVKTDGYVESIDPSIFVEHAGLQVSILCESSYFNDISEPSVVTLTENTNTSIQYSGDTPAGFFLEAKVNPRHNSPGEITKMTIKKDNVDCLEFDFSKMQGLVPNSSPNGATGSNSMITDGSYGYKYIGELPYENPVCSFIVDGEVHIIGQKYDISLTNTNVSSIPNAKSHYKWNGETWVKLRDLPYGVFTKATALFYQDELHVFGLLSTQKTGYNNGYQHYTYSSSSDTWSLVGDMCPSWGYSIGLVCVYHSKLYALTVDGSSADFYEWVAGSSWNLVNSVVLDGSTGVGAFGDRFDFECGWFVDTSGLDAIHLITKTHKFATDPSNPSSGKPIYYSYVWWDDGEHDDCWVDYSDLQNPPVSFANAAYVRRSNTSIYAYASNGRIYNGFYLENPTSTQLLAGMHAGWNWMLVASTPPVRVNESAICSDGSNIYFIGGSSTDTITEPPNDVKLTDNDIVEIDTVNGARNVRLIRKGRVYNIINTLGKNPKWFKLTQGSNRVAYSLTANSTTADVSIKVRNIYTGV